MSVAPAFIWATRASGSTECSHSAFDSVFGLRGC